MRDYPKLSWLNGKMAKQSNGGHKNTSGHNTEWNKALIENGGRTFASQVVVALEPTPPDSTE
jgi:hypothetical protein